MPLIDLNKENERLIYSSVDSGYIKISLVYLLKQKKNYLSIVLLHQLMEKQEVKQVYQPKQFLRYSMHEIPLIK